MLFIDNLQAAKAILGRRRYDHGQRIASVTDFTVPDEAIEPSRESQVLLPQLSAFLRTN